MLTVCERCAWEELGVLGHRYSAHCRDNDHVLLYGGGESRAVYR